MTPSEGTHFFQNLTSFGIGYFNVHRGEGGGCVDHDWLGGCGFEWEGGYIRHIRVEEPLDVWVDGRSRRGIVLRGAPPP